MTQTDGIGAPNQLRRRLSASAFRKNYDANWQHQRFEPITTQTDSISVSNQLRRKLSAWALRTKYDANCQHQRFEPIMTQTVSMSASNQLRCSQHQRFEPIMTQTACIGASHQLWRKLTASALRTNCHKLTSHKIRITHLKASNRYLNVSKVTTRVNEISEN